jgi:hypothetical protein
VTFAGVHLTGYLLALAITLVVEVPTVAAFFPGRRVQLALTCALATTATHLLLHFGFPRVLPPRAALLVGEAVATLGEAAVYAAVSREPGRALTASAVANGLSYGVGLLVFG